MNIKKLILSLVFLLPFLIPTKSIAQNSGAGYVIVNDFSSPFQRTVWWLRTAIPAGSVPVFTLSGTNSARFHTDTVYINNLVSRNDTNVYKLVSISSDAMLRAFIPKYLLPSDTNSLSNRVDSKLNITDTSFHWMPVGYVPDWGSITNKPNFLDSLTIYTIIGGKLNISDTIGKWIPIAKYISDSINIQAMLDLKMDKSDSVRFYPRYSNPEVFIKSSDTAGKWLSAGTVIPTVPTNVSAFTNDVPYLTGITSGNVTGALGFTPVPNTRTLTINGVSQDLSANRTWTVGDILSSVSHSNPSWISSLAWSKITGTPTTLSGYGITDGVTTSTYTSGLATKQNSITLTTTGVSGNATLVGATLNIPNYTYTPPIPDYTNTAAVAGGAGNAVFYITSDKTASGTALYTTITSVNPIINDYTLNYTYGWSYNAGTKALTVTSRRSTVAVQVLGIDVLGSATAVPNGTNVSVLVKGN